MKQFIQSIDATKYLNYLFILYAFSFPISKALTSGTEILMLLIWVMQGSWKERYLLFKASSFIVFFTLFILVSIVSTLLVNDIAFALSYIIKYYHFLMIYIIYTSLDKRYITYIFSGFLLSVFISELVSYGIFFELFTYKNVSPQLPTPFMHHITYSVVLAFSSMILLSNFFTKEGLYKWISLIFFVTIIINLFINGGRTGQLVFVILIFMALLSFVEHKIKAMLISLGLIIITIVLAYNYSPNFHKRINDLSNGFSKAINEKDYTDQGGMRISMILIGTQVFLDNPILGTGVNQGMKQANEYSAKSEMKTKDMNMFADYHNIFINTAAELGILGLGLLLLVFYNFFILQISIREYSILQKMFDKSFILFSCTHNTLHLMNPMVFFALFAGLFNAISRIERQEHKVV